MAGRFIKLYDRLLNWEWARNPNTLALFIYLLLKANYTDLELHGRVIRRGQLVTSLPQISTGTGLTIQQARTALSHLKSTGEITDESSNQYRIITVVQYDKYQTSTGKSTGNQQAINRQPNRQSTDELTPSIEYIEYIDNNRNIEKRNLPTVDKEKTAERFIPPTLEEISSYCKERNNGIDPQYFLDYQTARNWILSNGKKCKDWRATIRTWERNSYNRPAVKKAVPAQNYGQRDYSSEQEDAMRRMLRIGGDE